LHIEERTYTYLEKQIDISDASLWYMGVRSNLVIRKKLGHASGVIPMLRNEKGGLVNKILAVVIALVFPVVVLASGWTQKVLVTDVYAHDSGNIYLQVSNMTNAEDCTSDAHLVVEPGNIAIDRIYSGALSAMMAGKQVRLYLSGCYGSYPKLLHIRVSP
jgi:hypothetical protein